MQGHLPYYVALKALYDSYQHLLAGGPVEALRDRALPPELQAIALAEARYKDLMASYLDASV
jgi:hypothetical protein